MHAHDRTIQANVALHTAAADEYLQEPHHRPENKERIRAILQQLQSGTQGTSLLDVGCGMGFIIDIAKEFFRVIRGVDVTPAMLERIEIDPSEHDIQLTLGQAENLPYDDNTFDVCTAHALLHHLHDIQPVLEEVWRVLRPGGVFYADLDPNAYFVDALEALPATGNFDSSIVKATNDLHSKSHELAAHFELDVNTVEEAERWMHVKGGFKAENLQAALSAAGFSRSEIRYHWFLGEAKMIHCEQARFALPLLKTYLRDMLPLTRHLFKYVGVIAKK